MPKIINIKIIPNARKTELREIMADGTQKIAVCAIPEKGKANKALIAFYKKEYKQSVKIVSGETSQYKRIEILGSASSFV